MQIEVETSFKITPIASNIFLGSPQCHTILSFANRLPFALQFSDAVADAFSDAGHPSKL